MKYFKKIVGENVYLSPINPEDYEKCTVWMNDFETTDYIGRSSQLMTFCSEKELYLVMKNVDLKSVGEGERVIF